MNDNWEPPEDLLGSDAEWTIPDTVAELVEEWEKADEVVAAKVAQENALAEAEDTRAITAKLNAEAAALEKQILELQRKQRGLRDDIFRLGNRTSRLERDAERAAGIIQIARENAEREAELREQYARLNIDLDQFAYGRGLEDGRKILPHQIEAAKTIALNERVILADGMGVGKTLSMIAAMDFAGTKRALIITPADIASNFERELRTWAPHRLVLNLRGMTKAERHAALDMARYIDDIVVIVNYEAWRRDNAMLEIFKELQFDSIFMDEAHAMKRLSTNAQQGVNAIVTARNTCETCKGFVNGQSDSYCATCNAFTHIVPSARIVVPATGTPLLNAPEDLFPLLRFVDPNNFHNLYRYLNQFATMGPSGRYVFATGGVDSLLKRMGPRMLRRTLSDVGIELPRQQIIQHDVTWENGDYQTQREVYAELRKHSQVMLDGADEYGNPRKVSAAAMIALITRLRQAVVYPAGIKIEERNAAGDVVNVISVGERVQESIKVDKAIELIEDAWAAGDRVALFSQFSTVLVELEARFADSPIRVVRLDGSTPQHLRDEIKMNFDRSMGEESKWDVVLANYKVGGEGLNLTACTQMVLLDLAWNPGKEEQALARIARIGQTQETFVHVINVEKTVDTWMRGLIEGKRDMMSGFIDKQHDLQAEYLQALKEGRL